MVRRKFDLNLTPEIADKLDKLIDEEQAKDEETFHPPRPKCQILEMVVRLGLELYRAREKENFPTFPKPSETPQKAPRNYRGR